MKYFSDVPSMSNIASSEFSLINFRARSWRSLRSSHVMGEASPLRDFNRAREGGREESSFLWARVEANRGFSAREVPAVTPPTSRKRRREIISAPGREIGSGYYRGVRRRTRGRAKLLKYAVSRWLSVQAVENYKLIHPCAPNQPEPRQISACRTPIKLTLRARRPRVATRRGSGMVSSVRSE